MDSKKTLIVFNVIKDSQNKYGWSPSISEIAEQTGINRPSVVAHLKILRGSNIIKLGDKSRQISINPKNQWVNQ